MNKNLLITTAYPYLNRPVHIGNLLSIIKADILRRSYSKIYQKKVEYCQAYHSTGLPIELSLQNLLKGEESDLGFFFSPEEIKELKTFSGWIHQTIKKNNGYLQQLSVEYDSSKVFTTTEIEPIYSSFVKWFCDWLKNKKYLVKKDQNVIWCPLCAQPAGDHDRRVGEGVSPRIKDFEYRLWINKEGIKFRDYGFSAKDKKDYQLYFSESLNCYLKIDSLFYQIFKKDWKIKRVDEKVSTTGRSSEGIFYESLPFFDRPVICRCQTHCQIKEIKDQWFFEFNPILKKEIKKRIESELKAEEIVKKELIDQLSNLEFWPILRSKGIGTKPNFDSEKIVEPLWDSTFYQPLQQIIEPLRQIYNKKLIKDSDLPLIWNYLMGQDETQYQKVDTDLLKDIFKELNDWKTSSIHIVGKDLVKNHCLFSLITHHILKPNWAWPSLMVTGHLLINGSKISKSSRNYITTPDLLKKNEASVIRFCLNYLGEGITDLNLAEIKLYEARKAIEKIKILQKELIDFNKNEELTFMEELFLVSINEKRNQTIQCYSMNNLRQAIVLGFFEIKKLKKEFINYGIISENVGKRADEISLGLISPIIGQEPNLDYVFQTVNLEKDHLDLSELLKEIIKINKEELEIMFKNSVYKKIEEKGYLKMFKILEEKKGMKITVHPADPLKIFKKNYILLKKSKTLNE